MVEVQHLGDAPRQTNLSAEPSVWAPHEVKSVPDSHVEIYLAMRGPRKEALFSLPRRAPAPPGKGGNNK